MAGDEGSFVRRDEDDRVGNLLGEAEAPHRNTRHQSRLVLRRAGKTAQHASVRRTRRHAVHTDSRLGGLERHRLGDAFDGVLAAYIDRGPRRTLVPVGRGDVDNATAALSLHDAHFVLHAQDHAENIRVERRGIAVRGLVRDRTNPAFGAGIVHRDIETAKPCDGLVDQSARTSSSLRTSALMNSASEPKERSSLTSALPASSRRPATTTFAPFLAKATAQARPMPVKAPVINTTGLFIVTLAIFCPTGRAWKWTV